MMIDSLESLEALYSAAPAAASLVKVSDRITPHYQALIEASPFVALATVGPEGLDCSPRGDQPGFVRVADPRTLILPDRRGNNRIDSLRNVIRDPRVALLFLIPGSGVTFRVNGRARISADPDLLQSFAIDGKAPRTAMVITVEEAYFQCARAILRAGLWTPEAQVDPASLPSAGAMLAAVTAGEVGGEAYDAAWPERARQTMW
ncbi:MAG: flavin-nucleotide-binding protein [Caulobacter sp. 12-67-6]|nr:MAG: flavin-nucleotide-binding protein [Caulobacter sp. 12-67-6]OYX68062.1 MAG: flavin-nucleotide-binding protein [Caulobacter sp. 32-67-35]OYX93806.1 MAG: flavin-nucleotide-binding protein [Caulobacter sp. 35-67-4]OZA77418.1 MAG: flavin-nucleotide-binding protein [Caulobacter sp. 39-67-4]HQR88388.1 pyridoxamine 5'-phosphate oxidase family protein [Caulobacter sp.]